MYLISVGHTRIKTLQSSWIICVSDNISYDNNTRSRSDKTDIVIYIS